MDEERKDYPLRQAEQHNQLTRPLTTQPHQGDEGT